MLSKDLSSEAKQTFQVVAMFATILVVGIHYKSDIPDSSWLSEASWNELFQEYFLGGIARVAVPLFAFAAGLFYFRSDDGSLKSYQTKLKQRVQTVLLPYLIMGLIATVTWYLVKRIEGTPVEFAVSDFLTSWLLRPPAEQLWFLRDLMVLVLIAPLIRYLALTPQVSQYAIPTILLAWFFNWQWFPIIAGWRLLHMETLLFFLLGCRAVKHLEYFELLGKAPWKMTIGVTGIWCTTVALRVMLKPNFDLWYVNEWGFFDLVLHQFGILIGCVALFMISWRMRFRWITYLSGASFFVYLVHEYPLRAIAERVVNQLVPSSYACWLVTPLVVIGCYALAIVLFRMVPKCTAVLTGGRGPTWAAPTSRGDRKMLAG